MVQLLTSDLFVAGKLHGVKESLHQSLAEASICATVMAGGHCGQWFDSTTSERPEAVGTRAAAMAATSTRRRDWRSLNRFRQEVRRIWCNCLKRRNPEEPAHGLVRRSHCTLFVPCLSG